MLIFRIRLTKRQIGTTIFSVKLFIFKEYYSVMKKINNFTEGKILPSLIIFALPVLLSLFLQTMYGAVDMMIVGWFGTDADVTAISTGSWIMHALTAVITGLAMGTTIFIGIKIGEKRENETGDIIGAGIVLFGIISAAMLLLTELFAEQIATVMQSPAEAFDGTVTYIRICGAGFFFITAYNVLGAIFRGIGNSAMPLVTVAIACVCNIVGDLVFVGALVMGVSGAALATVLAQLISVIISLVIIAKMGLPFRFSPKNIRFHKSYMAHTFSLGFPIAFQDFLVCISFLAITAIINNIGQTMGVAVTAGVGVAEKVCGFIMLVPSAYMQSMSAFVSQNIGAQEFSRARKALLCGIITSLSVGVLMFLFTFFRGDLLAGIFAKDKPEAIFYAAEYLKAYAIDCIFVSFLFCFIGYFNGYGKTRFVMWQGLVGAFCVRIPVSLLMSTLEPVSVFGIGLATPCSTIVQITMCFIYFSVILKREKKMVKN